MNAISEGGEQVEHAIIGYPDAPTISSADWPAWSAGYETGLRDGIASTRLQVVVELAPLGPVQAGVRLWRALTLTRLTDRLTDQPTDPAMSGEQLRERARASWATTSASDSQAAAVSSHVSQKESL